MRRRLITYLIAIAIGLIMSGCASSEPLPPEEMKTEKSFTMETTLKFPEEVAKNSVLSSTIEELRKNIKSKYTVENRFRNDNTSKLVYGTKIELQSEKIKIEYLNGIRLYFSSGNIGEEITRVYFELPYTIESSDKKVYKVKITYPEKYIIINHTDVFGSKHDLLDSPKALEKDAQRIINGFKDKVIKYDRTSVFSGEVNSKYDEKSVQANFDRILQMYDAIGNKSNRKTFKSRDYYLTTKFYPYKNGTKVQYSVSVPYTIDSKGNSTKPTSSYMKELEAKIISVIND